MGSINNYTVYLCMRDSRVDDNKSFISTQKIFIMEDTRLTVWEMETLRM